jgi:type IV fimbrial biogenesis protein FimT
MTAATRGQHQRGTTLIEQIMVLAIIATLTGLAVPSMRRMLSHSQIQVAQTDFIAALRHTREAAVTSGRRSLFCPTHDGNRCNESTRWDQGWLLGHDANGDNQPDDGPLFTGHSYKGKLVISSTSGRHIVRFRPDGSASGSNITLLFCQPSRAKDALSVVVSNAGRIRGAPASSKQIANCSHMN